MLAKFFSGILVLLFNMIGLARGVEGVVKVKNHLILKN